jgi:hypothetical protein
MGPIVAGACLTHRRSAKAKGRAVASHSATATPWWPSAPLRLARAGSSTMPPRPLRQERDLRSADQMWPADRPPATFRFLHRDSRCRLFPPRRDFSVNSMPRNMAVPAASLSSRIRRGARDKVGPAGTRRERGRSGDERRDGQCRPHEGNPIPNAKRDGSMPRLVLRLLQPLGCCNGTAPRGLCRSPLSLSSLWYAASLAQPSVTMARRPLK